ncbi:MAG TPA: BamA/TamA family outer membrane protein [Thermoanaerobaculia bacterium]|nr:BamA/TamA family outer membrane protein [Thermoanaerobaculia bacterium]
MRRGAAVAFVVAASVLAGTEARAQAPAGGSPPPAKSSLFKDPEDGAFDVGAWAATRTGILPIPVLITEPAVGYGAALGLVKIHGEGLAGTKDAPLGASGRPIPPDVSALGGALTENGTWAAVAAHLGYWGGDRWRYVGVAGYMSPKLDTYDAQGRAYGFNLEGWVVYQELKRRVGRSNLFLGARFVFMDATTTFEAGIAPPDAPRPEFATRDSGLGAVAEFDSRDNTFTPSRGVQVTASAVFFGPYLGGENDYQRYGANGLFYWDVHPRLVLSTRLRTQAVVGDAPFYALPFVQLRGIPAMRYQGETAVSVDGEARWAATKRWWLVAFAGAGWTDAGSTRGLVDKSVHAGGAGFRYLIARRLGILTGLDFAKGPEQWALYVVFGSSW